MIAAHLVAWPRFRLGVAEAAHLGFHACEAFADPLVAFEGGVDALRELLDANTMTLAAAYTDAHLDDPSERDRIAVIAALLGKLGTTRLVASVHGGGMDLRDLGRVTASHGVTLCLHPHQGSAVSTVAELHRALASADPSVLALCADTAELLEAGADPATAIRDLAPRVAHVHLKDVASGDGRVCEIGKGRVDFPSVFRALDDIGYRGWVVVEMEDAESPSASVRRCVGELVRLGRWEAA
jgi:inosose dehydratase